MQSNHKNLFKIKKLYQKNKYNQIRYYQIYKIEVIFSIKPI